MLQAFGFFWLISCGTLLAETHDYMSLNIDQLLKLKVSVASKDEETIAQAPGIVSVVTRAQILEYGATNLFDVLRRIPGIIPQNSVIFPDNLVSIRGGHSSVIDRRTLVLINGRPFREAFSGGAGAVFYLGFPITAIERIEVVRGPGSALYGANAFSGVINVITRTQGSNELSVSGGSFKTATMDFSLSGGSSDSVNYFLSGQGLSSDGWNFEATDIKGINNSETFGKKVYGSFAHANLGSFNISAFHGDVKQHFLGSNQSWPGDYYDRKSSLLDLSYELEFSKTWSATVNGTHHTHRRFVSSDAVDVDSTNSILELTLEGELTDSVKSISGFIYNQLNGSNRNSSKGEIASLWRSAYTQVSYQLQDLRLLVGTQYNDIASHSKLSNRASVIWDFSEKWSVKALFGEAFRSPMLSEIKNEIPGELVGNQDLLPESMKTKEVQISNHGQSYQWTGTFFQSHLTDAIGFKFLDDGSRTFTNKGNLRFQGIEFEAFYQVDEDLKFEVSVSTQENEDSSGKKGTQIDSELMAKLGFSYYLSKHSSLALFNNYYSAPNNWEDLYPDSGTKAINPNTGAYNHLTANIRHNFGEFGELSLFVDNLLQDKAVYWPDISRKNVNAFPIQSERSFLLRYRYTL